jgi:predicted Fe-Mo cluster-binding NifX family protein
MNTNRIAIPSELPGGLEAGVSGHFGHCDIYTLVDVQDGRIAQVDTLPSVPHEQGGCLQAVQHLAGHGVTTLIAGGMGFRPLMGFTQAGIQVYLGRDSADVGEAVRALLRGDLQPFTRDQTCGGGHSH